MELSEPPTDPARPLEIHKNLPMRTIAWVRAERFPVDALETRGMLTVPLKANSVDAFDTVPESKKRERHFLHTLQTKKLWQGRMPTRLKPESSFRVSNPSEPVYKKSRKSPSWPVNLSSAG